MVLKIANCKIACDIDTKSNSKWSKSRVGFNKIKLPLAIRSTLMARMIVGLIGINPDFISSRIIPIIDSMTIAISRRFQLEQTHPISQSESKYQQQLNYN